MPAGKTRKTSKPTVRKPAGRTAVPGNAAATLPASMLTGKASPAKAADGDKPVFAYIASLPQPQRGIAERVDALAAKTLPGLQRSVKWGMSVLRRRRWLVLLLRRLRETRQAHVRERRDAHAGTASDAGGDGQIHSGRGAEVSGRPRRTPGRGMDDSGRGRARRRGEEVVDLKTGVDRAGVRSPPPRGSRMPRGQAAGPLRGPGLNRSVADHSQHR